MQSLVGGADGQTPLDVDEANGLLRSAIATRGELDIVEQENILKGTLWAFARTRSPDDVLDELFLRRLHREMFGDVWRWAGTYRTTPRNIGVEAWMIQQELAILLGDARYWSEHATYDTVELCVRFHHRLVSVHPFPNGNGRHARLATDVLTKALGREPFGWGRSLEVEPAEIRARYISALRAADAGDASALVAFAVT